MSEKQVGVNLDNLNPELVRSTRPNWSPNKLVRSTRHHLSSNCDVLTLTQIEFKPVGTRSFGEVRPLQFWARVVKRVDFTNWRLKVSRVDLTIH